MITDIITMQCLFTVPINTPLYLILRLSQVLTSDLREDEWEDDETRFPENTNTR